MSKKHTNNLIISQSSQMDPSIASVAVSLLTQHVFPGLESV